MPLEKHVLFLKVAGSASLGFAGLLGSDLAELRIQKSEKKAETSLGLEKILGAKHFEC